MCNVICSFSNSIKGVHHTETTDGLEIKNAEPSTETSSASTVSQHIPHHALCFVHDIFAALRDVGNDGELTNFSLALFGICTVSENSSGSALLDLAKETNRNQINGLEVLQPAGGNSALRLQ